MSLADLLLKLTSVYLNMSGNILSKISKSFFLYLFFVPKKAPIPTQSARNNVLKKPMLNISTPINKPSPIPVIRLLCVFRYSKKLFGSRTIQHAPLQSVPFSQRTALFSPPRCPKAPRCASLSWPEATLALRGCTCPRRPSSVRTKKSCCP